MIELKGPPGELHFTLTVTRAATGKVETFEMVGHADPEELKKILGAQDGSDSQHSGA